MSATAMVPVIGAYAQDAQSPHWRADGCSACHDARQGAPEEIPPERVTAACIRCHDGEKAEAEEHPVGRGFDRPDLRLPEGWPAPDGQLSCLTCHDVLVACKAPTSRDAANPNMIRGGPVTDLATYCGLCHVADAPKRFSPHRMLTEQGRINPDACMYCHTETMDPTATSRSGGSAWLRGDESALCLGCHDHHVDYFEPGHFGARPDPNISRRIAASGGRLPLSPSGAVTCTTCHNPHQRGTFAADTVLSAGGQRLDRPKDQPMELRGYGTGICGACHGR